MLGPGLALLLALIAAGCSDSPTGPGVPSFVPADIELDRASLEMESLGEVIQVQATVTDQDGRPGSGVQVEWSSTHPQVLESLGDGRFRSVANGDAVVVVRVAHAAADIQAQAQVQVRQRAVEVTVATAAGEGAPMQELELWSLGQELSLLGSARDAEGSPMESPEHALTWASDDPSILEVDENGRVRARGEGNTVLQVAYGELRVELDTRVAPSLRLNSCARFTAGQDPEASPGEAEACGSVSLFFAERGAGS